MYLSIPLVVRIDVEIVARNDQETRQDKLQQTRHMHGMFTTDPSIPLQSPRKLHQHISMVAVNIESNGQTDVFIHHILVREVHRQPI